MIEFNNLLHIQAQVQQFHNKCGLRAPSEIDVDWKDIKGHAYKLIMEEFIELQNAINDSELDQVVHEACDLLYVVAGFFVRMGINAKPFFDAVHEKNMEKAGGPKREDGKQLKPEGFEPLNMKKLMEEYYGTI